MTTRPESASAPSAAAMAAAIEARANDSSAELSAGGLVLTKNDAIELRAEDLSISPKQVRVNYRFFNTTSAPVQIVVAGKAHPDDHVGKGMIQEWINLMRQPRYRRHIG